LAPRSAIEWLLAIDVVELSWEIQRYRLLRQKVLESYRQRAVKRALRQIDLAEIPPELDGVGSHDSVETPKALNTEVYSQANDIFLMFEARLSAAQNRRMSLPVSIRTPCQENTLWACSTRHRATAFDNT
jgi:hypothetical protein